VACEVDVEHGHFKLAEQQVTIEQRISDIYHLEVGALRMILHHMDPSPAMLHVF
jgi:hypothetical protein